ncbi:MAG: cobalamin-binding protein, partial [Eubacteriales bacterium]|nr:cobalamin-binding protein [Eubacteriales bacterium]
MSMLMSYTDPVLLEAAREVFQEHFRRDPVLEKEMDERRRKLMYDDIIYNISYLLIAVHFGDEKIFEAYALWLFELLCSLMKDLDRDRISRQMTDHY